MLVSVERSDDREEGIEDEDEESSLEKDEEEVKLVPAPGPGYWNEVTVFGPGKEFYDEEISPEDYFDVTIEFTPKIWKPTAVSALDVCADKTSWIRSMFESMPKYDCIEESKVKHYFDVEIQTNAGVIPSSSFLLRIRSDVFTAMFAHGIKEAASKTVTIDDFNHDTVKNMIHYLYGWNLKDKDYDEELLQIADKYNKARLKMDCEMRFADSLSLDNVVKFWILAHDCQADNLLDFIIDFLKKNWTIKESIKGLKSPMVYENPKLVKNIFLYIF